MKKQTAVDWLVSHFKKLQSEGEKMTWNQIIDITKLAKELEKQQIIDANVDGSYMPVQSITKQMRIENAEMYFNETFEQ